MFTSRTALLLALVVGAGCTVPALAQQHGKYGFGKEATSGEIAGWNIDVPPDGMGLPQGSGTVAKGREVYSQRCVSCHGEDLKGQMGALVGGRGTLNSEKPLRTVGSYWPYATTVFDYVHRAMPFDAPSTLSPEDVYAVVAYILFENDIIEQGDTMSADTLADVKMPNRDGFYPDPRPDVFNTPCRNDCKQGSPLRQVGSQPQGPESGTPNQTGVGGGGSPQ